MQKNHSCSFTGHRAGKLPWRDENCKLALDFKMSLNVEICLMIKAGVDTFYTGMASGIDIIAGELVIELKEIYPHIRLIAVLPYIGFSKKWGMKWRARHFELYEKTDDEIMLNHQYNPDCFKQRNQFLVDKSSYLIAVHNHGDKRSGTYQTINMAKRKGRDIVIIDPKTLEVGRIKSRRKLRIRVDTGR